MLSFIIMVIVGYLIQMYLNASQVLVLIIVPIVIIPFTLFLYKIFTLVKLEDIYRYFGRNNKVSKMLASIYNV